MAEDGLTALQRQITALELSVNVLTGASVAYLDMANKVRQSGGSDDEVLQCICDWLMPCLAQREHERERLAELRRIKAGWLERN